MGNISIIARRLSDKYVQYGWSGNSGYFRMVGMRLLAWYDGENEELIDYLFSLGQLSLLGKPKSEQGGYGYFFTNQLTQEPHDVGTSENEIFSKIMFIDHAYFLDSDKVWYYIVPGPINIKIPLTEIYKNLNADDYEFEFTNKLEEAVVRKILIDYPLIDEEFNRLLGGKGEDILNELLKERRAVYRFYDRYESLCTYFDNWTVVKIDDNNEMDIIVKKKTDKHIETINW